MIKMIDDKDEVKLVRELLLYFAEAVQAFVKLNENKYSHSVIASIIVNAILNFLMKHCQLIIKKAIQDEDDKNTFILTIEESFAEIITELRKET